MTDLHRLRQLAGMKPLTEANDVAVQAMTIALGHVPPETYRRIMTIWQESLAQPDADREMEAMGVIPVAHHFGVKSGAAGRVMQALMMQRNCRIGAVIDLFLKALKNASLPVIDHDDVRPSLPAR